MVRPDLSNAQIEAMHIQEPGSAARYLEERRKEIEAEKQAQREQARYADFEREFVAAGGTKAGARQSYARLRDEAAERAAVAAEEAAVEQSRRAAMRGV